MKICYIIFMRHKYVKYHSNFGKFRFFQFSFFYFRFIFINLYCIIIIIIIKSRAELETTRKKALPVGGLIHSHTDKRPHANPGNVQHS